MPNDTYAYLPMSRNADGRIITNFGPPQIEDSGLSSNRAGSGLSASSQVDSDHRSEINSFIYRLEGTPNASETITFDTVNAAGNGAVTGTESSTGGSYDAAVRY